MCVWRCQQYIADKLFKIIKYDLFTTLEVKCFWSVNWFLVNWCSYPKTRTPQTELYSNETRQYIRYPSHLLVQFPYQKNIYVLLDSRLLRNIFVGRKINSAILYLYLWGSDMWVIEINVDVFRRGKRKTSQNFPWITCVWQSVSVCPSWYKCVKLCTVYAHFTSQPA